MSSIDIVVPCYRYGRFLRQCVQSILTQGIGDLRVLIIDDQSPDETPEVGSALAREDSRVTYRRHAANRGHISTYNEGIEWLRADYMLLLSADDYLLPGALQRAMELMDANGRVGLCFGSAIVLRADGTSIAVRPRVCSDAEGSAVLEGDEFIRHCALDGASNIVPTPTAVVRTSLLKQLGGYRLDLPHSGDLELWLRLAAHGSVAVIGAPQAVYRRHRDNMSIAYFQDSNLTDLQQRKAAFDAFLATCGPVLASASRLHTLLVQRLAREMLHGASDAFNHNRLEQSRCLRELAIATDPRVRASWAWISLTGKRLLGFRLSSALLPIVTRIRTSTMRGSG